MEKKNSNIKLSFWIFIILLLMLVTFSVQNSFLVTVKLIFWQIDMPLAVLLISTLIIGVVGGMFYSYFKYRKQEKDSTEDIDNIEEDETI